MVYNIAGFVLVWFCVWCSPGNSNPDCIVLIFSKTDGDLYKKKVLLEMQNGHSGVQKN